MAKCLKWSSWCYCALSYLNWFQNGTWSHLKLYCLYYVSVPLCNQFNFRWLQSITFRTQCRYSNYKFLEYDTTRFSQLNLQFQVVFATVVWNSGCFCTQYTSQNSWLMHLLTFPHWFYFAALSCFDLYA